jgi:non-specific serine/threonine protein kinase
MVREQSGEERSGRVWGFGAELRRRRAAAGLSQDELAERAGLSAKAIGALERGERRRPHARTVDLLAAALGLTREEGRALLAERRSVVALPPGPAAPRHNLPLQRTSFVGRDGELAAARRLLETTRLLTLTGTGGCGKTRLALALAETIRETYPDGVWLVELATLADPGLLPKAIAVALGVPEQPREPIQITLAAFLRSRCLLLVLDNCEHLIAACARLADDLLLTCPTLRVLATSREALGIPGEVAWRVPSLTLPDRGRVSPNQPDPAPILLGAEAAQLFVERARAVEPGFSVTPENARAIAEICWRLDGIPLALELAAARVKVLSVEQIAARLDDRFQLLTGGSRTALPRQQTLRATLDWSYHLLTDPERALFRRLSVFAGGFTLDAAEAVWADNVLDLVSQLVDKSLILVEKRRGEARYRLLETVRQYAEEKPSEAGEAETARRRHRDWCLSLAEQALPEILGPDQQRWLDRLEDDHDNLRAALARSLANPLDAPLLLRLAAALGLFWRLRGHHREGIGWLDAALARSGATPTVERARALDMLGHLEWLEGNVDRARPLLEESVAQARIVGKRSLLAMSLRHLGYLLGGLGDWAGVRPLIEEAVAVGREAGDKREVAAALHVLAVLLTREDTPTAIESLLVESLANARESGDPIAMCLATLGLSWVCHQRAEFARARQHLEETLVLARRSDVRWPVLVAHLGLGDLAAAEQDLVGALNRYRPALRMLIHEERGHAAYALDRCAMVCAARGQYRRAAHLFGAASAMPRISASFFLFVGSTGAEKDFAAAGLALGETEFAAAWADGRAMTPEQALEYALAEEAD